MERTLGIMKYPINCKNIIDVTKPPYNADNTGKTDCTKTLQQVFTDVLKREAEAVEETVKKLIDDSPHRHNKYIRNTYLGFETRCENGILWVIYPEFVPPSRIIYFPAGTYLVSDTITYFVDNLKNVFGSKPFYELCRGIHVMGESKESVTIKLADNCKGFEIGSKRPVLSLCNVPDCCEKAATNVAQMNTVEDLTIDCGKGNPGAVGLLYMANNSGRVQNVDIKAQGSWCGLRTAMKSEGSFVNVKVEGFDYGADTPMTSLCAYEDCDFSKNKVAAIKTYNSIMTFRNIKTAPIPMFEFDNYNDGTYGQYYCIDCDVTVKGDTKGNNIYSEKASIIEREAFPVNNRSINPHDYVCVDDFGAVGDGETDCTDAIQAAMNSGKPIVLFGDGHYLINGEINIPETVKTVDFMFCDLFAGDAIIDRSDIGVFNITEDSKDMLFLENLYAYDQFHGMFRLIKHGAKRDLCMSDLHTQAASMYFNTVSGSKVYMDNCACTTGTYSTNLILSIPGRRPIYSAVIPYEFHGQTVYGRQVNPERADVEMLNDGSTILIDGLKVEGPGTALKSVNGGKNQINIFWAGIGKADAQNALFDMEDSELTFTGGIMAGQKEDTAYNILFKDSKNGNEAVITSKDMPDHPRPAVVRVDNYTNR